MAYHREADGQPAPALTWFDEGLGSPITPSFDSLAGELWGSDGQRLSPTGRVLINTTMGDLLWADVDGSTEPLSLPVEVRDGTGVCVVSDASLVVWELAGGVNLWRDGSAEEILPSSSGDADVRCYPNRGSFAVVEEHDTAVPRTEYTVSLYDELGTALWSSTIVAEDEVSVSDSAVSQTGELWLWIVHVARHRNPIQVSGAGFSVTVDARENSVGYPVRGGALVRMSSTGTAVASRVYAPGDMCDLPKAVDAHGRGFGWCEGRLSVVDRDLDDI